MWDEGGFDYYDGGDYSYGNDYSSPSYDYSYVPQEASYTPQSSNEWYDSYNPAPRTGGFSIGGGDPTYIQSAPSYDAAGYSYNPEAYRPASYGPPRGNSYTDDLNATRYNEVNNMLRAPAYGGGGFGAPAPSGGGQQGARNVAQQTPQMITMGKPEDDLYKRYKGLLMDPSSMQGDPAYQFMYNQGLQALNRSLAAKRLTHSGKALNDTMAYGAGMANQYMQSMLPQYRAGATEELQRFLGPAGLLPRYAGVNNATISGANNMVNANDDRAMYRDMLSQPGGGSLGADWGSGIGYGGMSSRYTASPQAPSQSFLPQRAYSTASSGLPSDYDLDDLMDETSFANA